MFVARDITDEFDSAYFNTHAAAEDFLSRISGGSKNWEIQERNYPTKLFKIQSLAGINGHGQYGPSWLTTTWIWNTSNVLKFQEFGTEKQVWLTTPLCIEEAP